VIAVPGPGIGPEAVGDAFRRAALPLVLHAQGWEVLHGSAVLMPGGVVALCGASGSGKSTIAYGLNRRGWSLWADDTLALDVSRRGIRALPVPFDIRLRPPASAHFGLGGGRARLAGGPAAPASAPLEAVCVLAREAEPSRGERLVRLGVAEACPAILPHAYCFSLTDRARKRVMLERYLRLLAQVPVFRLRVPAGLGRLPDVLAAIEEAFGAIGARPPAAALEAPIGPAGAR
jgi:hypothetical protein